MLSESVNYAFLSKGGNLMSLGSSALLLSKAVAFRPNQQRSVKDNNNGKCRRPIEAIAYLLA